MTNLASTGAFNKFSLFSMALLVLTGCGQSASTDSRKPSEVYLEYHAANATQISFEQHSSQYSKAKQHEVLSKLKGMRGYTPQSMEQFTDSYLSIISEEARCSELILREERIEGRYAYLVFDRKDLCANRGTKKSGEKITMLLEKSWKVHDSVSSY